MALYRPDYKLSDAQKVIEKLDPSKEKDELILYYIKNRENYIKTQQERLEAYANFFRKLDGFLPNHNPRLG